MKDNQAKYPQLRFKGFTDPWEQCKLRGILAERNDQITETNEYPLMSFVQGKGVTPKGKRYNRSFLVKDVDKKYKKTELGDFIYSSNNLETGSIGFNRTGKAVISPVYSIFKSKREQESQFIGIMSARKDFIFKMIRFRQGVVYGQWRIHESDFLNIDIRIPSYEEQQSIICFFEKLNKAITLHQRKLAKLKELKQGYLQKLFPQNGSKFPQLRFAGFADAWEQRKLSDAIQLFGGNAFKSSDVSSKGVRWLKIANVGIGKILWNDCAYLPEHFWNIYKDYRISDGDYLVALTRPILNHELKIAHIKHGKALLNQRVAKIIFNENPEFTYQLLRKREVVDYIGNVIAGTDPPNLGSNSLHLITVNFPSIDEQKNIGECLNKTDHLIASNQRKLEKLQELKKGYLQKMFC